MSRHVGFREVLPTSDRKRLQEALRREVDEYFDEIANVWADDLRYSAYEANQIAQSLHRYRLIVFSNFLTTVGGAKTFEPNLVDILADARPGSVIMVLGGSGGPYPEVYGYMDALAKAAGFELEIDRTRVSSADTEIRDRVYEEGLKVHTHLQSLGADAPDGSKEARRVRSHFTGVRKPPAFSQLWAYRKHRWS